MTAPNLDELIARLAARRDAQAIDSESRRLSYSELMSASERWRIKLTTNGVVAGNVCGYIGDWGADTIALFIALPMTQSLSQELPRLAEIAGLQTLIRFNRDGTVGFERFDVRPNPLIVEFRKRGHPGLVVFTSGSTGVSKGILHDIEHVLGRFMTERRGWRTVLFLMMDHFGGINTLLSVLIYGGVAICVAERSPDGVCRAIARGRANLLPTTPTFLKLILASGVWRQNDLSSIRMITYGTEPMPEATLRRVREIFPYAEFKQTYGLSELGVLHSQSPDSASVWLRIGGTGFETKVVGGLLHVRSSSSMVGYLNAPSPIDSEGWMNTGDLVEERDGLIRFLGRASEVINVAGQKVSPTEVEAVLLEADNVTEATVFGIRHPVLGQAVGARVTLARAELHPQLTERLREHCRSRLAKFKIPLRFEVVDSSKHAPRAVKKQRQPSRAAPMPESDGH
jgi:long-chain acyl-CoA synthetase